MSAPATVRILAPAKLNLWLRVLHRRTDGFHELDTLFQAVDLCDEVEVSRVPGSLVTLSVEGADVGPAQENLAYRAALAFLDAAGPSSAGGVHIRLVKRIPAGAGLGGGSSDAAAVLRCMNALHADPLPVPVLAEAGAALGSDVAFFLGQGPLARGRGRGEVLQAMPSLPARDLVLVFPPVHVATGPAYGALARHRSAHGAGPDTPVPASGELTWADVAAAACNDFEAVVPVAHPPVAASLEALRAVGARPALLSGSGGACFGLFTGVEEALEAAAALEERLGWHALAVRTLSSFPLPSGGGTSASGG